MLQINSVAAGNAINWYQCGWKIFSMDKLNWVLMTLVFFVIVFALGFIPLLGMIAVYLLLPLLQAGMISAADKAGRGEPIDVGDLFIVFKMKEKRNTLLALGGIMLATVVAVMVFSLPFIGGGVPIDMSETPTDGTAVLPVMGAGGLLFAVTAGLLMAMMFFYAPVLVILRDMGAVDAIKTSFAGTWKNGLPFVIFMLAYIALSVVAAIPFGLGFLILLPIVVAASYCSYKDIFA